MCDSSGSTGGNAQVPPLGEAGSPSLRYLWDYPPVLGVRNRLPSERPLPPPRQADQEYPMNDLITDVRDEAGQTMAEYAVVLGVITIAVVVTLGLLSTAIKNLLNNVISSL